MGILDKTSFELFQIIPFYPAVQSWMKSHKGKNLGIPRYWGSGLHEKGGKRSDIDLRGHPIPPFESLAVLLLCSVILCSLLVLLLSRYRFMVIDRLGTDLQKKFEECGRRFPRKLVLQLGLRLVGHFLIL